MHTDEQGVSLPDAGFAEALAEAALTISHEGEQRSWVLLTMASHRVAERLLPLTLEALSRIPADQGLSGVGARLLPAGSTAAAGATAFTERDLGRVRRDADDGQGDIEGSASNEREAGGGSSRRGSDSEDEARRRRRRLTGEQLAAEGRQQVQRGAPEGAATEGPDADMAGAADGDSGDRSSSSSKRSLAAARQDEDGASGDQEEGDEDEGDDDQEHEESVEGDASGSSTTTRRTLDSGLVVMTWDKNAQDMCLQLRKRYSHQCLQDVAHKVGLSGEADGAGEAAAFHSAEFVAIGFAKIKYLVNSLSLGYDLMAMDADVVVLRSPLPSVLPLRPHLAVLTEKCEVVDMAQPLQPREVRKPGSNIGVMFLRSEGPALRCMSRWFGDMSAKTDNPRLWDQEEFDKVITACAPRVGLRWHSLDNRRFVSMCQPGCGCSYPDSDMQLLHVPQVVKQHKRDWWRREGQAYADARERSCGPEQWADWVLVHFPCQGGLPDKERYMSALLDGYSAGEPRVIKNTKKIIKRSSLRRRHRHSRHRRRSE
ncbi:hypothetical protein HXX76_007368 [Chlamydomonas incerta]|uniref:Nucleotide-diphospho-sugar transferase domain-containing protein n=1 Tax=Chlamydomonas incerta TaxID=51695 RepID=A0A835SXU0_CHLIN|nr:hypothetical protein HXX76_007368 [Chlamydomonas incerta]|eukprot:KAG2435292.1 hypothetical protein HXX76_007368 [Chlamydomonas incerta]